MKGVGTLAGANPPASDCLPFTPSKLVHIGHKETHTRTDGRAGGWNFQPSNPPTLTEHFSPNTCPRCHHITVAGIWLGFRVDLEPTVLDDLGEYQALVDEVTTWNLWPDMIARPRTVASILHPNVTDRHAEHSCAATYGTLHPTPRPHPTAAPVSDAPPF